MVTNEDTMRALLEAYRDQVKTLYLVYMDSLIDADYYKDDESKSQAQKRFCLGLKLAKSALKDCTDLINA